MERKKFITDLAKYSVVTFVGTSLLNSKLFASNSELSSQFISPSATNNLSGIIPTYQNVTTNVRIKGKEVKIHGLCTGTVAVKTNFRTKHGLSTFAKLNMFLDKHFTEYMPIWVWVIEHPEGLIVIDTGENAAIKDVDKYLIKEKGITRYATKHLFKFNIDPKDELNHQLDTINLKLDDVKLVALTHLHIDHTDGLKFFPKQEIIVGDFEFKHQYNTAQTTFPSWFKPNKVAYKQNKIDIFNQAYSLTSAEDLLYIPTPGHTHGHSSIVFKTDNFDIIFAGDTSYNQEQVLRGELAGGNADFHKSAQTYKSLIEYATIRKTIYLPSHDGNAGLRLSDKVFLV